MLHPSPEGLSRAVPVILTNSRRFWAEEHEIAVKPGFRIIRNGKDRVIKAIQLSGKAIHSIYYSNAGEHLDEALPCGGVVHALRGFDGHPI